MTKVSKYANLCLQGNKKKGSEDMGEKEKSVMERLVRVLPTLSDFDRGYILGKAEQTAEKRREEKKKKLPVA